MSTDFSPYLAGSLYIDSDHPAVRARAPEERDLPEIWPEPLPQVVASLTCHATVQDVAAHLPDVEMLPLSK
ncbi:hypothetical protein [Janthinobacterium sp. LB3P118]|uniref:hypothetical protein n=1 Tax=Janthinobacterium sp. LB3P118 TaxID=3424195 RepID=UPI003F1F5C60